MATFAFSSPELLVRSDTYCDPGLFHPLCPPGLLLSRPASIWDSPASDHVTHKLADLARLVKGEVTVVFCRYECTYGLFFFNVFLITCLPDEEVFVGIELHHAPSKEMQGVVVQSGFVILMVWSFISTPITPLPSPKAGHLTVADVDKVTEDVLHIVIGRGSPQVFREQPVPVPAKTHTCDAGAGFHGFGAQYLSTATNAMVKAITAVIVVVAVDVIVVVMLGVRLGSQTHSWVQGWVSKSCQPSVIEVLGCLLGTPPPLEYYWTGLIPLPPLYDVKAFMDQVNHSGMGMIVTAPVLICRPDSPLQDIITMQRPTSANGWPQAMHLVHENKPGCPTAKFKRDGDSIGIQFHQQGTVLGTVIWAFSIIVL
ncbi:hypothetical protein EI94DRAFT_1706278 [Lactarius quietus]|nr:hypothetical protein EI94DRAFT_1706278 [Lactarius quietus]